MTGRGAALYGAGEQVVVPTAGDGRGSFIKTVISVGGVVGFCSFVVATSVTSAALGRR
jgi:hypothetical protein